MSRPRALIRSSNPFKFPGTKPGFDPSHIAAQNAKASTVVLAGSSSVVNLLSGAKNNAVSGSPASGFGVIGPAISNSGTGVCQFTTGLSVSAITNSPMTFAGIFVPSVVGSAYQYCCGVGLSNGAGIGLDNAGHATFSRFTATSYAPGGTAFVAGVPYFMAGSTDNATKTNIVALRLDTGQLITFTGGGAAVVAPSNTFNHAGGNGGTGLNGLTSCAMYAENFQSLPSLVKWASDPWEFWYPR